MSGDTCIAEPRPGRVPRELACRPRSQQPAAQQSHRTSEHRPPPPPPPLTGARDRSQQRAACRARAPIGRGATSPPAPSRRLLARPRPASHSWAHPFPFPPNHTTVRAAPAASGGLQTPGRTRRGAEPLYSPLHASKRESEPVAVLLIPLVIVTTPYRTDTSYSIFGPPNSGCRHDPEHAAQSSRLRSRNCASETALGYTKPLQKTRRRSVR